MTTRRVVLVLSLLLALVAGTALFLERGSRSQLVTADPHGTTLPAQREVQISYRMPSPSGFDGLHAKLVGGAMPTGALQATVLTDEQCQPDSRGISRCLNRLRLPDGSEIEVRHPHDMREVACLAPGEHVRLVPTPTS